LSRVKRQAREEIFTDENENPFLAHHASDEGQDSDSMQIDDSFAASSITSTPTKHGVAGRRIEHSPLRKRTHFITNVDGLYESSPILNIADII